MKHHGPLLRVVAGQCGGLRLRTPKGAELRPTQDRIKQVIFSALADRVEGARVLDLYAGTGALGIEALSRGAASVVFVESNRRCVETIRDNLAHCRLEGEVNLAPVERFLAGQPGKFDLILADPPYDKTIAVLDRNPLAGWVTPWLAPDGLFVWEHFAGQRLENPEGWTLVRDRNYGETGVSFLQRS